MALSTGTRLGPYEIVAPLGAGGTSEVYRAHDTRLGRDVAVKLLGDGDELPLKDEIVNRFEREARAAGSLNHPNVLAIFDIGTHGRSPYLVYELLEGRTLRDKLRAGRLPLRQAIAYALQIARGLAAAHDKGIVHRDLKPENLFVTGDDGLKILDFGLAKLTERAAAPANPNDTRPGVLLGSVGYMAPEQILGRPADHRADIFAFGAIVYEMLCGERPFAGSSDVEALNAILTQEPQALATRDASIPPRLSGLVTRCVRKDPEERCQSAQDLVAELEVVSAIATESLSDEPTSASIRPERAFRRRRIWLLTTVSVMLAALLLAFALRDRLPRWPAQQSESSVRQLAVLPFRNVGGDARSEAFCAGLVELLTTKLSQLAQYDGPLRVVSAMEVLKEGVTSAKEARTIFGANLVLAGSVHSADDKVTVLANLVDTKTQFVLAARNVEVPRANLAALDEVVIENVADMLQVNVEPQARRVLKQGLPAVPGAYDFYLQGLGYLQRYDRTENLAHALQVFRQALLQDPNYALAYAGLAEAQLRRYQITKEPKFAVEAKKSCLRAIELNDQLWPAHFTLGMIQVSSGEPSQAIKSFETALRLQPGHPDVYRELANAYDASGRTDEAEATYRRAIQLRQNYWAGYTDLGVFYTKHGRLTEALEVSQRVVELTPDNYYGYRNLGGIYIKLGRHAEAAAMLKKSLELKPNALAYSNLGVLHLFEKRYREASELFRKAIELSPVDYRLWGNLGHAYRWAGAKDEAARAYRQALVVTERQRAIDPKDGELLSSRALYLSALGERQRALEEIARALRVGGGGGGVVLFKAAIVYEQSGRRDKAIEALEAAVQAGFPVHEIQRAPALDALRTEPRVRRFTKQ